MSEFDYKQRPTTEQYRKNYDKIFRKRKSCGTCLCFRMGMNQRDGMCKDCVNYSNYREKISA